MTGLDTVRSQLFRLSLEDLVDLERKRKCGMSRREILANVYCPVTPSSPVITPAQVIINRKDIFILFNDQNTSKYIYVVYLSNNYNLNIIRNMHNSVRCWHNPTRSA